MPTEQLHTGHYFDTPSRAERLQLLLHLARNAGEVIYLRAPAGAGKTLFAQRLFDTLGDETAIVWVRASEDCDVAAIAVDQLGLSPDAVSPWPDAVLAGLDGQNLLVIVDDADRLGLEAVEGLAVLHARGGRLLLVGQGGLAQTSGNWDVQFVDLPNFEAEQTLAFLRSQAGEHASRVTDDLAAGLHRASNGLPGPLLDALHGVLGGAGRGPSAQRPATRVPEETKRPAWHWLAGGLLTVLLVAALLFQDPINSVFLPEEDRPDRPAAVTVESVESRAMIRPLPPRELAPVQDLQAEAVSPPTPEIAVPELSTEPAESATEKTGAAAGPEQIPVETTPDRPVDAPAGPAQPDAGRGEDPLDAVMRDALAAAEAGKGAEPAAAELSVVPDMGSADKTSAETASPTEVAAADKAPQETAVTTDEEPAAKTPAETVAATAAAPVVVAAPVVEAKPEAPTVAPVDTGPKPAAEEPAAKDPPAQDSRPVPAPVESRQAPPSNPPVVRAEPAEVVAGTAPRRGSSWLETRAPGHYTLQLVGARDRAAVQKFVRDYGIKEPYAIFERDLKGKPWYSLVAGDYPDRDAAIAARGRLPQRLERSGIWPRTFASIQKSKR